MNNTELVNGVLTHAQAAGGFNASSVAVWFAGAIMLIAVIFGVFMLRLLAKALPLLQRLVDSNETMLEAVRDYHRRVDDQLTCPRPENSCPIKLSRRGTQWRGEDSKQLFADAWRAEKDFHRKAAIQEAYGKIFQQQSA